MGAPAKAAKVCKAPELKPGWDWGQPAECASSHGVEGGKHMVWGYTTRTGTNQCCPGYDNMLSALTLGLNSEMFASVVTFGNARSSDGQTRKELEDATMRFMPSEFDLLP